MRRIFRRTVTDGPVKAANRGLRRLVRKRVRLLAMAVIVSLLVATLPATSGTTQAVRPFQAPSQESSFATQLYSGLGQTLASLGGWLGSFVAGGAGTVYQPVAAYLAPAPPFIDAPTNLNVTATSATSINLSWTAPGGSVDHYQVERSTSIAGPFFFVSNTGATTFNDTTVTNPNAYLYRVRAVTSSGLPSAPSNLALGTAISFEFSSPQGQIVKAQHFYDVRTAVNLVRGVAGLSAATWTRTTLAGLEIKADDVNELRTALNAALTALSITVTAYTDPTLTVGTTLVKAIHLQELQLRSTRGSSTISGPIDPDSSAARLDPLNETGGGRENPLSRNFNWNLPLVKLRGRAGLDLSLTLSYNSLVWTKSGNTISFDDDNGFPAPGFRLGFPVIQQSYFNSEVGKNAFILVSSDGSRTELRQVGSSALYEAADSSYLLLDSSTMTLRTADGTQLSYSPMGTDFNCTKVTDRNGNFITINYLSGRIDTVVDTLARNIKFNYDANGLLTSITQIWNAGSGSQVTHNWATFTYTDTTIQTSFSASLTVFGPANNSTIKTLSKVTLPDGSHSDFSYSTWGQVWKISNFAPDNHLFNYHSYNLPQTAGLTHSDCPRFTERRDWVQYWNGDTDGTIAANEEAVTIFDVPASDTWTMPDSTQQTGVRAQVTLPDGTVDKIYFIGTSGTTSGWRRALPALVNTYDSSGVLQRQVMTTWTQDNTSLSFVLNPRVTETNIYDPAGNRARTETTYQQHTFANGTSCNLPRDFYEYAANATTKLRSTRTDYNTSTVYTDRRILGLVSEKQLYEGDVNSGGVLRSKTAFFYDEAGSIQGTAAPVQHDNTNYTASFVAGRGNLSSARRYNVDNLTQFTVGSTKYNTAGAVVSSKDGANHEIFISYADSFSDGNNSRNTHAYATTQTDADSFTSTSKYHFDFGAVTSKRTPQPNDITNTPGPEQLFTFDTIGRLQQISNSVNAAYSRFEYPTNNLRVDTYTTIQDGLGEAHSFEISDGAGRVIAKAKDHPGSTGGFSGQRMVYDVMGRRIKISNPTETTASGAPSQWTTAGDDAAAGWIFAQQTFDWKGRPLVKTHQNGSLNTASYTGCGCAGGEVATLTDEGTFESGTFKRRQRKIYTDVLGRTIKTEILNWEGGSVYSATVNTYNARDQVTEIKEYAGAEGSGTFQVTSMTYDGFGRMQSQHVPEQSAGTSTVWTYNDDDTVNSITDARGASQTFGYNNRHLRTSITYAAPGGISVPGLVTFGYDAAGNRSSMTDGLGSKTYLYDPLSRLTQETRLLSAGSFAINYSYNLAGQLTGLTDPFGQSFSYTRNVQGQLRTVTGSPYAGTTNYVNDVVYRAWGAPKSVSYPGTTAITNYNSRMQPNQFRWTSNSSGGAIMSEDYGYFGDGQISTLTDLLDTPGTNPPVTLRFLSRSWSYDHVGRVKGGGGTGSGSMPGVPYNQFYSYDQFGNMTQRGGNYYNYTFSQPAIDNATYVNNRRTNWAYNAEGQVTGTPFTSTDFPRTMAYDAAGRMVTTVESGEFSTITYSASFDGDGQLVFESSNKSPGTFTSSYILRSTVLGGEVLTRVNASGGKVITHVPAEGFLFATQHSSGAPGAFVMHTMRNPLGISETTKAVYDPLGNYIPFRAHGDPRPPAGSYNSGSMSGLSSSQSNPDSYGVGCVMDGMPTPCNKVIKALSRLPIKHLGIHGFPLSPAIMTLMASFSFVETSRTVKQDRTLPPSTTYIGEDGKTYKAVGLEGQRTITEITMQYVMAPGKQLGFEQNQEPKPQPHPTPTPTPPPKFEPNKVYLCSRKTQIGGVFSVANSVVSHYWIRTDEKEGGLGPGGGGVPGEGGADSPYVSQTSITDHKGESEKPGATCTVDPDADPKKVNEQLQFGKQMGRFSSWNNCWTFAKDVLFNSWPPEIQKQRSSPF